MVLRNEGFVNSSAMRGTVWYEVCSRRLMETRGELENAALCKYIGRTGIHKVQVQGQFSL